VLECQCAFADNIGDEFHSFSIVKETVMSEKNTFLSDFDFEKEVTQFSEIEKKYEPNRFSVDSKSLTNF